MNLLTLRATPPAPSRAYSKFSPRQFVSYVFGRFMTVRSFMVWLHCRRVPALSSSSGQMLTENVDVEDVVRKIRRDGFFPGLRLRKEALEELQSFCAVATCFGDERADRPFRYGERGVAEQLAGRPFKTGRYNKAMHTSPALRALTTDTQLIAIARKYLGTEPVLVGARIWWSFPVPAGSERPEKHRKLGQGFHYDIDSYRDLTFFFYLNDVGVTNGAHVYVRGTHDKKLWKDSFCVYKRRTDDEIDKSYGRERQVLLCGPAGYGFAEDLFGFHKGHPPESGERLIIQIRYSLRDYGKVQFE
jgi:hypothetical protein